MEKSKEIALLLKSIEQVSEKLAKDFSRQGNTREAIRFAKMAGAATAMIELECQKQENK